MSAQAAMQIAQIDIARADLRLNVANSRLLGVDVA